MEAIQSFPAIIGAVKDGYGLLALCVLLVGLLAYVMTRDADPRTRALIFVAILFAFVVSLLLIGRGATGGGNASGLTGGGAVAGGGDTQPAGLLPGSEDGRGMIFPDSSRRTLDPAALAGMSAADLRIARNEIYARHGMIFASPDLAEHFRAFAWYRPVTRQPAFNPTELINIAAIRRAETAAHG